MPKVISRDGTAIAYTKKGEGPNLILVLGALNKRGSGKKLADLLARDFTVTCYDRRGRGDSTDTQPYSTEREVEDIAALIDELGGEAYLYGHSSGAILSLMAAAKLGGKVAGLALYELPHNTEPAAQIAAQAYRKELKQLLSNNEHGEAVALFVRSVGVSDKQINAMKGLPMWKGLTAMAPTLAYDTIELMEQYSSIDTKLVKQPALVMYGSNSPDFMGKTAQELTNTLPNATMHALEGQTHDVKAEILAPDLTEFFKAK